MDGEILATLRDVTQRLRALHIDYMLTGSLALGYYVKPRMTRDIDIVIELESFDPSTFLQTFGGDYYAPKELIENARTRGSMFNVIHEESIVKVDFVIRRAGPYREEEFARRRRVDLHGIDCWLVSPEDLILSKLLWMAEVESYAQMADVKSLLGFESLDLVYLNGWAKRLAVEGRLEGLRRD